RHRHGVAGRRRTPADVTAAAHARASAVELEIDDRQLTEKLWRSIFGNDNPTWIEIGPGRGEFLLGTARQHRDRNFFAVERSHSRAAWIEEKLRRRDLGNARVVSVDASCFVHL